MIHYTYIIYYIYIYIFHRYRYTSSRDAPHFQYDCFNVSTIRLQGDETTDLVIQADPNPEQKRGYLDGWVESWWWSFLGFPPKKLGQWWEVSWVFGDYIYIFIIYISPTTNLREPETACEILLPRSVFQNLDGVELICYQGFMKINWFSRDVRKPNIKS